MRWYSYIPDNTENCSIIYNRKCPPNNSVYEEWITVGLENDGAHNINLVTPTHFVDSIINALDIYKPDIHLSQG